MKLPQVQWSLNNSFHTGIGGLPYSYVFGQTARCGMNRLPFDKDVGRGTWGVRSCGAACLPEAAARPYLVATVYSLGVYP